MGDERARFHGGWPARLLWLYPAVWRARYGDEMLALLEQHTITMATILDLLWGALDARLDPTFTSERMWRPMSRMRTSAVVIFCAYAAFTLGYVSYQRLTDPVAPFNAAAQAHPELGVAYHAITWAVELGFVALLAGGAPIILDIVMRAWRGRAWRTLLFLATPVALAAISGAFLWLAQTYWLTYHPNGYVVGTTGDVVVLTIAFLLLAATGLAGVVVVAWIVGRSEISLWALRLARWPALVLTLAMAAALAALGYWTAQSFTRARWLYNGYASACGAGCPGPAATNQIGLTSLALVGGWMLCALILAVVFLARGFQAPHMGSGAPVPVEPQPTPARG